MAATEAPPRFEALYRFPHLSKRWKSVGVFASEAEASAALTAFLKDRTYKTLDRWIHRLPVTNPSELPK